MTLVTVATAARDQETEDLVTKIIAAQGGDTKGIELEHEDYVEMKPHFKLARDAYFGDKGFLNGDNILKYSTKEPDERTDSRKARAYFAPITRMLTNIPINAIEGAGIHRDFSRLPGDILGIRSAHGDWKRTFRYVASMANLYGFYLTGIGRKKGKIVSNEDAAKLPLALRTISPVNLFDWSLDARSDLEWIKWRGATQTKGDWATPQDTEPLIYVWSVKEWVILKFKSVEDASGKITASWVVDQAGPNNTHEVPFDTVRTGVNDGECLYGSTEMLQVARMNHRIFNQDSEIEDQLASSASNTLLIPVRDGEPMPFVEIGDQSAIGFDPTLGAAPHWISPSSEPVDICIKNRNRLSSLAYEVARLGSINPDMSPATAVQTIFDGEESERVIRALSEVMERHERNVIHLCLKWEGHGDKYYDIVESEETLKWPTKFDMNVLRENYVSMAIQILSIKWPSEDARKAYIKHFCLSMIPLDAKVKKRIAKQTDESDGVLEFQIGNNNRIERPITDQNDLTPDDPLDNNDDNGEQE